MLNTRITLIKPESRNVAWNIRVAVASGVMFESKTEGASLREMYIHRTIDGGSMRMVYDNGFLGAHIDH